MVCMNANRGGVFNDESFQNQRAAALSMYRDIFGPNSDAFLEHSEHLLRDWNLARRPSNQELHEYFLDCAVQAIRPQDRALQLHISQWQGSDRAGLQVHKFYIYSLCNMSGLLFYLCIFNSIQFKLIPKVRQRRWFSWLVRFRGLSLKGNDEELLDIPLNSLDDPTRTSKHGGLDSTWTTDLKLNLLCGDVKAAPRASMSKLGQVAEEESAHH